MENQLETGKYAKIKVNRNGNLLIELCTFHNLIIPNTYHLLRKNMNFKILDSRSFISNITRSDPKPVVAKIQIK